MRPAPWRRALPPLAGAGWAARTGAARALLALLALNFSKGYRPCLAPPTLLATAASARLVRPRPTARQTVLPQIAARSQHPSGPRQPRRATWPPMQDGTIPGHSPARWPRRPGLAGDPDPAWYGPAAVPMGRSPGHGAASCVGKTGRDRCRPAAGTDPGKAREHRRRHPKVARYSLSEKVQSKVASFIRRKLDLIRCPVTDSQWTAWPRGTGQSAHCCQTVAVYVSGLRLLTGSRPSKILTLSSCMIRPRDGEACVAEAEGGWTCCADSPGGGMRKS